MVALPVSLNYAMSRGDPDEQFPICEQESFQNSLLSSASAVVSPVSLTSFVFHLGDAEFYVMHERENCLATRLDEHRREYHGSSRRRNSYQLSCTPRDSRHFMMRAHQDDANYLPERLAMGMCMVDCCTALSHESSAVLCARLEEASAEKWASEDATAGRPLSTCPLTGRYQDSG
jgi:hypothetical protein